MKWKLPKKAPKISWTVRTRLLAGFLLVAAIAGVAAGAGIVSVNSVSQASNEIVAVHNPRIEAARLAQLNMMYVSSTYTESLLWDKAAVVKEVAAGTEAPDAEVRRLLNSLLEGDDELGLEPASTQDRPLFEEAIAQYETFTNAGDDMVRAHVRNLQGAGDVGAKIAVTGFIGPFAEARAGILENLNTVNASVSADIKAAENGSRTVQTAVTGTMIVILIGSIATAIFIGLLMARLITAPLNKAVALAEAVAAGDLSTELEYKSKDELGVLVTSLNGMSHNLAGMIGTVRTSADELASAAQSISRSTLDLNKGVQVQSSSTEETSASIEEIAVSIDQVAANAVQLGTAADETAATITQMAASIEEIAGNVERLSDSVNDTSASIQQMIVASESVAERTEAVDNMTDDANRAAGEGAEAVSEMNEAMQSIAVAIENTSEVMKSLGKRSKEIGEITDVIDDIAEQTNLLALNAAIEAARAGEHGRGFAVVAEAVRDLAERATASTKEISHLIDSIREDTEHAVETTVEGAKRVHDSRQVSEQATSALKNVIETFSEVSDSMKLIRSATVEQAKGGQRVLQAVSDMTLLHKQVDTAIREQSSGSAQIVTAVERMGQLVSEVVTATGEQKRGGEHMVLAMNSISDATRHNLTGITELAASAEELAAQSGALRTSVAGFKLKE
ncbi:MAG: HAMP domain-containing methyl-accepting chemotaxis protein [Coriobacteriia bacterium]|nr:HAMP domain-containing methyl-accepting chemotaxis protein [Coriobacteriia bacterium]